jgi:hypothetical protein
VTLFSWSQRLSGQHVGRAVVLVDCEVERAVVGVGTKVEQQVGDVEPIVGDGDDGGRCVIAVLEIQIRAPLDQGLNGVFVAIACRPHQRGEATRRVIRVTSVGNLRELRLYVRLGAGLKQRAHDLGMTLGRRPHQRGLLLVGVHTVDVGALGEEQAHRIDPARTRSGHQRGLLVEWLLHIGAASEQGFDDGHLARAACLQQRGHPVTVCDVRLRTGGKQ